ncbi:COX15/CtaA family protein [Agromyces aerolatus]|uniref:COX15/CtaA family protein n=1 Tax=Agromyces sp. LY-1074 TaxID=3074080 RepID=UPI0028569275|nr:MULTISPECIES: COX15/CtaA family protein [unclassified Agromyces]MDR5700679.1 COX15/CtaA family protein [Agromyces sp. LY-1074]MDR5707200.1 COX15/CtaA family protein [Agromyces sp. LY-1358]
MHRFVAWLPDRIDGRIRTFAWLSFLAETIIIATGGAVRLTSSGLGCPTWPLCTHDSLIATPEMGIHGIIEFGNRLMTGVVGILAVIVIVLLWRLRSTRRDLWTLALIVGGGVVAQAIVGGITVWMGLNPFIVGFHYVSSLLLVCVTAAFLARLDTTPGPRERAVPGWYAGLTHLTSAALAVSIVFGVLTTGAGPHSGDADAGRNGFNAELLEHVHAWPGYAVFALVVVLVTAAWRLGLPTRRWSLVLLGSVLVQVAVGLIQARTGLPPVLVGIHMVLAALTAAAMTVFILQLKRPVRAVEPTEASVIA